MSRVEFESTTRLRELMTTTFQDLGSAAGDKRAPIAWCTSVGPAELLRALGFVVYFPENHGAMLGASRMANRCMSRAHALGYSPDICSYLTSDIGAFLSDDSPLHAFGVPEVPRADVLVFNTNQCRDVRDWFDFYGRVWDAPVIGITSLRGVDEVTESMVDAIARQIEDLVEPLERIADTRLDAGKFENAIALSRECSDLWKACLETAAHRPSPLTFFDGTIHMFPAVVLRGTSAAGDYYRGFLAELEGRIRDGLGAIKDERHRLYWDGMPIWGRLSSLAKLFAELGTSVVASTYCNSWIFEALDPADPFRSMARASLELFIARAEKPKQDYIEQMVERFGVDGVLFHDSRTCPNNSNARYGMPGRLQEHLNLPVLTLDGDLNDLRCFSDEQARTNIEGFVEQLAEAS